MACLVQPSWRKLVLLAHPTVPHAKFSLLAFAGATPRGCIVPSLRYDDVRCKILPEPPSWRIPRSYNVYYNDRTSSSDPSSSSLYRAAMILFRWRHCHRRRRRRWPYFPAVADGAFPCGAPGRRVVMDDDDRYFRLVCPWFLTGSFLPALLQKTRA
jgi:hypothetical protein